jgi:diguanylate cyclase (GGDEF)-like protein
LRIFASVLAETVCDAGSVAHYGGEEFAVILPGAELEDAKELTERLRCQLETKKLAIAQLSVGEDAQRLVQRADTLRGQVRGPQPRGCRPNAPLPN